MVGMFDNKKTNPEIIRNLKAIFTEKFYISKIEVLHFCKFSEDFLVVE